MAIKGWGKQWKHGVALLVTSTIIAFAAAQAERINQEGRILGPAPVVTTPTLFNTSQGDAIVSAMQIFPVTNPWNEDVSRRPLLANSDVMIPFLDYADESDLDGGTYPNGSYPIPSNMPIESWPRETGGLTLQQWQMDVNNTGGDRHAIIVAP